MNRRSATWVLRILLLAAAISLPVVVATPGDAGADDAYAGGRTPRVAVVSSVDATPSDPVLPDTVPPDTANPFFPEERDLTDCLGLLQRPGCGSEARGGLGQTLVAIAMIGGLVLIFGRVAWGVRRNRGRRALPSEVDPRRNPASNETHDARSGGSPDGDTVDSVPRDDAS